MVREFELPDVGEGLTEAEIVRWLVEPGDTVSEDQPVAEVETDKAVVEVPSPVNGTVEEILAEEGEMVPVGTVIVTFRTDEETAAEAEATDVGEETADAGAEAADEGSVEDDASEADTGSRVFAAPSTRRLARELDVELGTVEGSGPGGRVTESDVREAAEGATEPTEAETEPEPEPDDTEPKRATRRIEDEGVASAKESGDTAVAAADRRRTLAAPATRKLAEEKGIDIDAVPTDRTRDGEAFVTPDEIDAYLDAKKRAEAGASAGEKRAADAGGSGTAREAAVDERIPYRGVRRTIGEQMARSKYTAPHVTHHDEVDVTDLVEIRGRLKERAEEHGTALSYLPFVIKAVVAGLKEYPILNSRLDEEAEEIVLRKEYNVGVATATDAGLMVPVIDDADRKGMLELAEELNTLVSKARDRTIERGEMQDGTFTITNFGAVGGEYATPIINYPETAILGLGAIKEKPRVVDGEIRPRKVLTLSLSIDHRVIDGAEAAQFTNLVGEYLESPELLLLD